MERINNKRLNYIAPSIEEIGIDSEVSLVLQSEPPTFEQNQQNSPCFFQVSPIKDGIA